MIKKKLLCAAAFSFLVAGITDSAIAQLSNKVTANVSGNILRSRKSDGDIIGSPYLADDWSKGNVKFKNNTYTQNADLRYDVLEDVLVVKGSQGEENIFSDPVDEFTLNMFGRNRLFKNGFIGAKDSNEKSYFEVIANGDTKFLKRWRKIVIESKGYNTSTVTKKLEGEELYYIAKKDNTTVPVKRNEKAILDVLNKPELSQYIKANKLNVKDDADIEKLFSYYNSL